MADNTGAAFGVFPQMRPRRARQDREAAANAPLSALRGWAAGTAGLPGDIEGLLRMLVPGVSNESALPTSEFYKEWLPGRSLNETPTGRAFTEAGSLTGGVGVGPLSRVAATGARAGGRLGAEALMRAMERGSPLTAMANPMYVVKPKGGNWLSGSVEDSLKDLRNRRYEEAEYNYFNRQQADAGGAYQDWLQAKWAQDPEYRNKPAFAAANEYLKETGQPLLPKEPINAWIDKQLTNYVKNEMATPEDPLRALAEKWAVDKPAKLAEAQARIDALASKIEQTAGQRNVPPEYLTSMRQQMIDLEKQKELIQLREGLHASFPDASLGVSGSLGQARVSSGFPGGGLGKSEAAQNWELASDSSLHLPASAGDLLRMAQNKSYDRMLANNPWLAKVPPETQVNEARLGLADEVGFTHLIDELRNATYPDSGLPKELLINPKDLPKITLPQAVDRVADINAWRAAQKAEADMARANNAATVLHKDYPDKGFKWVELKSPGFQPDESGMLQSGRPALEDALKYEGDTMQHCVGGYCPDVLEGRSRIFSLRSAKGQPHVTIEVKPWRSSQGESLAEFEARLRADPNRPEEAVRQIMSTPHYTDKIVQIKGKANRAPNPEYLPYVQDFVKSGKWSDVGDLQNTDLLRLSDFEGRMHPVLMNRAREKFGDYATQAEMEALHAPSPDNPMPGFAQGGLVQKFGKGGVVKAALEEARDTVLKLKQLRDSGQLDWQSIVQDIPTRFYRGMSAMVRGGEDSPKYFEDLTEKYLGAQEPLSGVTSLGGQLRPPGILTDIPNMRKNMAWAASNPLTAASYASMPNSVMIPLDLVRKPEAIFDAKGAPWRRFFSQTGGLSKSGKFTLDSDFRDALRDPEVKSVLVKNIYDTGGIGSADELSDLYGLDILPKDLISSNLLIKDPSAVRYVISGETPLLKEPKLKKAEGGLVQYDPAKIDALTQQLQEELYAA